MKDIIITPKRIGRELLWLFLSLLLAEGLNLFAIFKYQTQRHELWTQWLVVGLLGLLIYAVFTTVRMVLYGIFKLLFRHRSRPPQDIR